MPDRTAIRIGIADVFRTLSTGATPLFRMSAGVSTTMAPFQSPRRCSSAPQMSSPFQAAVRRDTNASRTPSRSAVRAKSNVIGRWAGGVRGGIGLVRIAVGENRQLALGDPGVGLVIEVRSVDDLHALDEALRVRPIDIREPARARDTR